MHPSCQEAGGNALPDCPQVKIFPGLTARTLRSCYRDRDRFIEVIRHTISLNGSFFNTQRMLSQYMIKAYLT